MARSIALLPIRLSYRTILSVVLVASFAIPRADGQKAQQVAQSTFPSVVLLVMEDENSQPVSLGSGFFVRDGLVATNLHVVETSVRGYAKLVGHDSKFDISGFVAVDPAHDLVLLSVAGAKAPPLSLGDSSKVAVGDEVFAVGNPQGLEGTFSQGIISSLRQMGSGTLLQTTAPISPGSSGGPVVNDQAQVIGVAVATLKEGQNLNFAIPASYLRALLTQTKPAAPLPVKTAAGVDQGSILSGLGGRNTEGVIGTDFKWDWPSPSDASFSLTLQNKLHDSIRDVHCLVVFYGAKGDPLDVAVVQYQGLIPAGLGKRISGHEVPSSVRDLTSAWVGRDGVYWELNPSARVDIRVLDFRLAE
jgi:Trypsin-like peptidase domain